MNWKDYLKSQGYSDAEIVKMETEFGGDKLAKAFEGPVRDKQAAESAAQAAKAEKEEFERFYTEEVTPKLSSVYQDAINARTENASLRERLKSATEYGFLDPDKAGAVVPGVQPGQPVVTNTVPGSPSAPGAPASTFDTRYVAADKFATAVDSIPDMLGRLTKMSNEHFSLFGSPLLDVDTLIADAKKGKKNVIEVWEAKYKVNERRDEIKRKAQEDHDRQVGDEAVRKYASEHGQPFLSPGRPSVASQFTSTSSEDARQPWKNAKTRQAERRSKLLTEFQKTGARVQ